MKVSENPKRRNGTWITRFYRLVSVSAAALVRMSTGGPNRSQEGDWMLNRARGAHVHANINKSSDLETSPQRCCGSAACMRSCRQSCIVFSLVSAGSNAGLMAQWRRQNWCVWECRGTKLGQRGVVSMATAAQEPENTHRATFSGAKYEQSGAAAAEMKFSSAAMLAPANVHQPC